MVRYNNGTDLVVDRVKCNELYAQDGELFFDTVDSQCYFPGLVPGELKDIAQVTVTLRFVALADSALKQLVDYQKKLIDGLRGKKISGKIDWVTRSLACLAPGSKKK